jgi:general secretion pathway protein H
MTKRAPGRGGGFTLVEIMVVLVIIGVTLGLASPQRHAQPAPGPAERGPAHRAAAAAGARRSHRAQPPRSPSKPHPSATTSSCAPKRAGRRSGDDLLRERDFKNAPLTLLLDPTSAGTLNPLRITFGREPVDKPFVLTLASGNDRVAIRADGVGHFVVE